MAMKMIMIMLLMVSLYIVSIQAQTLSPTSTATKSKSSSNTDTNSISATVSHSLPPPPTNLINTCHRADGVSNHIKYLCLQWTDTSGLSVSWTISFTPNGPAPITVTSPTALAEGLNAGTLYTFTIIGMDAAGRTTIPYVASLMTSPDDARTNYKVDDLQNPTCVAAISNNTLRPYIKCSWAVPAAPASPPTYVKARCRCISPEFVHDRFINTRVLAPKTYLNLLINRAQTTCKIELAGYYTGIAYHLKGRGHVFRFTVPVAF